MINGSFEQPWTTFPTGNQEPAHWTLATYAVGSTLRAPKAGNGDTETKALCVPECVHKLDWQLPAEEQLGGPKALILEGKAVYKIFGKSAFRATLAQQWTVTPGAVCSLTIPVQVHGGLKPDGVPYNVDRGAAYWRVTINGTPGPWFTFIDDFPDREWVYCSPGFKAIYGTVDLLIEFESHTLAPIDFFIDGLRFTSNVEPQPPAVECPKPRPGWESRTTVLVRADAPDDVWLAACKWANDPTRRHSVDKSWDHAFYAPGLYVRIILWVDKPHVFSLTELMDFGDEYYGDIAWHIEAYLPYDQGGDPDPPLPPVEPPTGNAPQPIEHYSGNFVGLQHYIPPAGWLDYIRIAKPTVTKCFSCGDAIRAKQAQPQMLSVWRKVIGNDEGQYIKSDRALNANWLVMLYEAELDTTCNNMGITRAEALKWIDVIESLNETIPSNNAQQILNAVDFDVLFSLRLAQVFEGKVKAGILNVAVGNPYAVSDDGGKEIELLLPAARESHAGRAMLGYHGYFAADATQSYLYDGYAWHAFRFAGWDTVFNLHGLYPQYYLGECGICATYPESHGTNFISTKGWKTCGNFPNYIKQLEAFNELIDDWNYFNQGRCHGGSLFISGHGGWLDFDISSGNIALLREAMKVYT